VAEFGPDILRDDGEIDRGRLGARVFANPAELARLEAIVHPAVGQAIEEQIANLQMPTFGRGESANRQIGKSQIATTLAERGKQGRETKPESEIRNTEHDIRHTVVIEAIKLIETGRHETCHALWVVTAPYQVQLERLMRRRGLGEAEARLRIEAQPPQADKTSLADVVIDNGGDIAYTHSQVIKHWEEIVKLEAGS
jgi:dephospho-CoA kinase